VSSSSSGIATPTEAPAYHNPSYPPRTHYSERSQLEEALRACDQRLKSARQRLNVLANHAENPRFVRLFHQLQGACDQVAEAVRRLPLETGGLYHEDHERFHNAMEAAERTWQRWEASSAAV
jgi:exonuclease VII large subunit